MIELFRDKSGSGLFFFCDGEVYKVKAHITLETNQELDFKFYKPSL